MTSQYPGAIDNFSESSPTYMSDPDATGRVHSARHDDVESAIEQVEETLGVNPQGANVTVADKLAPITSNGANVGIGTTGPAGVLDVTGSVGRVIVSGNWGEEGNMYQSGMHKFLNMGWGTEFQIDSVSAQSKGRHVATHYWDESVGRRLFVWDMNNARWQMVYGDTGWRDVTPNPAIVSAVEKCQVRRINNVVHFTLRGFQADASAPGGTQLWNPEYGWEADHTNIALGYNDGGGFTFPVWAGFAIWSKAGLNTGAPQNQYDVQFTTAQPWPASLPGTASGVIPTADTLLPDDYTPDLDPEIPTGLSPADDTSGWTVTYPEGPTP